MIVFEGTLEGWQEGIRLGTASVFHLKGISPLAILAPGDFAAVIKKLDILGEKASIALMLRYLKEECLEKAFRFKKISTSCSPR